VNAGAVNSTFTLKISSNTVTKMQGIQVGFDFNNTYLNLTAISRAGTACDTSTDFSCVNASNYWVNADTKPNGTNVANSNTAGQSLGWAASYNQAIDGPGLGGTIPTTSDAQFLNLTFRLIACPASGIVPAATATAGDTHAIQLVPAQGVVAASQFTDTTGSPVTPLAADLSSVDVTCTPPVADDFSLSAAPGSVSIAIPASGTNTGFTTITSTKSGNGLATTLSTSALPTGVTAAFTPGNTITAAGGSVTLTFSVSTAAVTNGAGVPITVTGTPAGPANHATTVTLVILPTPTGPTPATGITTVSGTTDAGTLGLQVPAETSLALRRNWPNTASVPVLVFTNIAFSLKVEDAMLPAGKLATDRGHMTDTAYSPAHSLTNPMKAQVGAGPVRTLDVVGPQTLMSDSSGTTQTVNVSLLQQTVNSDPPGSFAISLTFTAVAGF
jgi:hypothetical protein